MDAKIANSEDLKNIMKQYNVCSVNELLIVFVYLTDELLNKS